MTAIPVFESARLRMRPWRIDDATALHAIYADRAAMTWWSHAPHDSIEQTRDRIATNLAQGGWRGWAMTRKGDDGAIGTLAANEKRQGRVFEIGYSLARAHWGQGFASEALAALIDLLVDRDGARRIFADIDPDNAASIALVERLGFVREGRLRAEWETHIGVRDSLIYGLLATEWRGAAACG